MAARLRLIHSAMAGFISDPGSLGMVPDMMLYIFLCLRIVMT